MSAGRIVIIGPGKLGCGFLAPLFIDAGWDVVFAARTPERTARIDDSPFAVRTLPGTSEDVYRCPAVTFGSEAFRDAVAAADLILTTVSVEAVAGLGPELARALAARPASAGAVDVWVVENADVAPVLEQAVKATGLAMPPTGFAGAIAYPIVARGSWDEASMPVFVRDSGTGLRVDETRALRPLPRLAGVEATGRYQAHLCQKRVVFGAGHALTAYLGALLGYERVDEAVRDPFVRAIVESCLRDARAAFAQVNPDLAGDAWVTVAGSLARYEAIEDPISRVGRSPIRKLSSTGAVLGAAKVVAEAFGTVSSAFAVGIAGALLYADAADAQARELAGIIRREGAGAALTTVAGLEATDPLHVAAVAAFEALCSFSVGARPTAATKAVNQRRASA